MNKKFTLPLLLATTLVATSCSNDENVSEFDDSNLSRIELGSSNVVKTRAGFTEAKTALKLHYVSTRKEYNESTFPYKDGEGKGTLYMTSSATAEIDGTGSAESVSEVTQTIGATGQKRYWDDIHGKNSILALYAIAVPNQTDITNATNKTAFNAWDTNVREGSTTNPGNTIAWTVSASQTLSTVADEDLTYSNNVKDGNSLVFNTSTNKFEKAEGSKSLVFNHALSRFTITVKKGDGFGTFSDEFNVTSVKLNGFTVAGTLNVETGGITPTSTDASVETVDSKVVYPETGEQEGYTYVAQVFPNTTIKDVDTKMLTIVVDGNNYPITGAEIFNSLKTNNSTMDESKISSLNPGTNYNLTIIIKKTGIEIASAKLVPWEEINGAEMIPSNAIALEAIMEESAGTQTTIASDIYRSTTLATGYVGNKNTLSAANVLGTIWYWPDNDTKYFLRTISPQNTTVTTAANDYITMEGGAIADANDFIWGAPFKETHGEGATEHKFTYNNGYANTDLYPAIGVTKTPIHITQFHMMSNIEVNLSTSTGGDAVTLTDATVEILNYDNSAKLALSNAAITLSETPTSTSGAITTTDHLKHTWRVIPQTTTGVTFKITAAGNVYVVNLPAETGIADWLPGKSYVYNFKLLKTAIQVTSAKLVDWESVTAADKTVTLE